MTRDHGLTCRCWRCRHDRFNPGPPTTLRRAFFYGNFSRRTRRRYSKMLRVAQQLEQGRSFDKVTRMSRRMMHGVAALLLRRRLK